MREEQAFEVLPRQKQALRTLLVRLSSFFPVQDVVVLGHRAEYTGKTAEAAGATAVWCMDKRGPNYMCIARFSVAAKHASFMASA